MVKVRGGPESATIDPFFSETFTLYQNVYSGGEKSKTLLKHRTAYSHVFNIVKFAELERQNGKFAARYLHRCTAIGVSPTKD